MELTDYPVLAVLADRELDDGLARLDAELVGPLDAAEHRRRLEELLGGHTTPVQAGAAHLVLLHQGHRQARGPRVQSRGVPAGPATDHDYVELRRLSSVRWQTDHLLVSTMTQPPGRPPVGRPRASPRPGRALRISLMTLDWPVDEAGSTNIAGPGPRRLLRRRSASKGPRRQPVGRRSMPAATVALVCSSTSTKLPVSLLSRYSS